MLVSWFALNPRTGQGTKRREGPRVNADLEHVILLQAQDLERKRLREELTAAPAKVRSAGLAQGQAQARLNQIHDTLRNEEALRQRQGADAEEHRGKLHRLRRQLASATSAAQITALEHEISFGETAIRKLEDEELDSLVRTEGLELEQAKAAAALSRNTATYAAEQIYTAELTQRNEAALAGLEGERRTVRGQIGEPLLALYDRVSGARGTGLAEASEGQCTACRMKVRPQRWNDLIGRDHEDEIFTCESCGRVLFYDPRRNTPGSWAAGDRLTAALNPPASTKAPLASSLPHAEARA